VGFVSGWVDLSYVSGIYFDEANQAAAPPRTLLGAALSVRPPFARSLALTVLGSNLLDQREAVVTVRAGAARYDVPQAIADFAGYPLPGRSLFVALTFSTEPTP
jgi:hypothetical protein